MAQTRIDGGRVLLLVAFVALGVVGWEVSALWPLKLLAVLGHETGHALASMLVGGEVNQITVAPNEGGSCLSMIPQGFFARVVVSSGGYVGGAIIAALLLLLTFRWNFGRPMLAATSVWLVLIGLFYGRDLFTFVFCGVMAVAFGLAARFLPLGVVSAINLFMATFTALYAVMDLKDDLWNSAVRAQSDAQILADATHIPAIFSAFIWTLMSVAVVGVGAWYAVRRPIGVALPTARKAVRVS
jgi:Peptidase M50B-like